MHFIVRWHNWLTWNGIFNIFSLACVCVMCANGKCEPFADSPLFPLDCCRFSYIFLLHIAERNFRLAIFSSYERTQHIHIHYTKKINSISFVMFFFHLHLLRNINLIICVRQNCQIEDRRQHRTSFHFTVAVYLSVCFLLFAITNHHVMGTLCYIALNVFVHNISDGWTSLFRSWNLPTEVNKKSRTQNQNWYAVQCAHWKLCEKYGDCILFFFFIRLCSYSSFKRNRVGSRVWIWNLCSHYWWSGHHGV